LKTNVHCKKRLLSNDDTYRITVMMAKIIPTTTMAPIVMPAIPAGGIPL
jgi:hypothetical protein